MKKCRAVLANPQCDHARSLGRMSQWHQSNNKRARMKRRRKASHKKVMKKRKVKKGNLSHRLEARSSAAAQLNLLAVASMCHLRRPSPERRQWQS